MNNSYIFSLLLNKFIPNGTCCQSPTINSLTITLYG